MKKRAVRRVRTSKIRDGLAEAKSYIVKEIGETLKRAAETQHGAAEVSGLSQPEVSALITGRPKGFSFERLFRVLNVLERQIVITIKKSSKPRIEVKSSP
jgi:predicted XRE-type DNA-binding protein